MMRKPGTLPRKANPPHVRTECGCRFVGLYRLNQVADQTLSPCSAVTHTPRRWDRRDQWSSTFSNCTARAALSSRSPSSLWRRARLSGRSVIELPHEFLNATFAALIIVANVMRFRTRLRGPPDVRE